MKGGGLNCHYPPTAKLCYFPVMKKPVKNNMFLVVRNILVSTIKANISKEKSASRVYFMGVIKYPLHINKCRVQKRPLHANITPMVVIFFNVA